MNHASIASVVVVTLVPIPVIVVAIVDIVSAGHSLAAVQAVGPTGAVVVATDEAATAMRVAVAVSLPFIASVVGGAAGPVAVVGVTIYNGDTEYMMHSQIVFK